MAAPRTDNAWVKRNDSFNARAKQGHDEGDIGVVFLGDSITEGWEGAGRDVWAKSFAPRHAVNFGIGGDRTQHVLWRIQNGNLEGLAHPAKGSPPKLAVIMIGTNNTGSDTPAQIAEGIAAVVEATHERLPNAKILLLAVFPRSEKATDPIRDTISRINTRAAKLTDKPYVTYLDIGDKFLAPDGTLREEIMPDRLHLSAKGYQIWADAIDATVRELLGDALDANPRQPPSPAKK
jgi:beta-glucosidase